MRKPLDLVLLPLALIVLAIGEYAGLALAPKDALMGDVYRIMFVHVPSAWIGMLGFTVTFGASLAYLWKSSLAADALAEAGAEIGVVFSALVLITGSIWGKPTWGVWWTWDPRLTSAAIMWIAFSGYLALRRFVDQTDKRAAWSAVAGIIIFVDIPIVWFSVKWWNSLHQIQQTKGSMDPTIAKTLALNVVGFLILFAWLLRMRYALARQRQREELVMPPETGAAEVA